MTEAKADTQEATRTNAGELDGAPLEGELLDSELLRDAKTTQQRSAMVDGASNDGELKTTRFSPAPPPPLLSPSVPPLPPVYPPSLAPARATQDPPPRRPSWLQALLTSTAPPSARAGAGAPIHPSVAGAIFAGLGLVFAALAFVTGLRGAPEGAIAPAVAAAVVIARALVTLGAGALSFLLLRSAERLLVAPNEGDET